MPQILNVQCRYCYQPFHVSPSTVQRGWGKFCSKSCLTLSMQPMANAICHQCHKDFVTYPQRLKQGKGLYCSLICRTIARGSAANRFFNFVDKSSTPDGCWPWTGRKDLHGYGKFSLHGHTIRANRFAYELEYGLLLPSFNVCHACDNPSCCRVTHLFPGTQAMNIADKIQKGRNACGEKLSAIMRLTSPKGEKHGMAKLKEKDIIRIRHIGKTMSVMSIAQLFNVSKATIQNILNYHSWRHIP